MFHIQGHFIDLVTDQEIANKCSNNNGNNSNRISFRVPIFKTI